MGTREGKKYKRWERREGMTESEESIREKGNSDKRKGNGGRMNKRKRIVRKNSEKGGRKKLKRGKVEKQSTQKMVSI